jgi:hypothetical protein
MPVSPAVISKCHRLAEKPWPYIRAKIAEAYVNSIGLKGEGVGA